MASTIIVETRWIDTLSEELFGGATNQVVDQDFHASERLDDAVTMAKRMTSRHQVAFVRRRDLDTPQESGRATL